jgi:hypothetical protein
VVVDIEPSALPLAFTMDGVMETCRKDKVCFKTNRIILMDGMVIVVLIGRLLQYIDDSYSIES